MAKMHLQRQSVLVILQIQSINKVNKRVGVRCERVLVDLDELDKTFGFQSDNPADQTEP